MKNCTLIVTKYLIISVLFLGLNLISTTAIAESQSIEELKIELQTLSGQDRAYALLHLTNRFIADGNFKAANKYALEAELLASKSQDKHGLVEANNLLGDIAKERFDYTNAMTYYVQALRNVKTDDNLNRIRSKTNIGRTFFLQRDFDSAEENLKTAFDLNVEIREPLHTAIINEYLGDLYLVKEIFGKARSHYKKALETRSAMNDLHAAAKIARRMGKLSLDLNDLESADIYYGTALDFHSQLNDLQEIANDNLVLGKVHENMEDYQTALEEYETAVDLNTQLGNNLKLGESVSQIAGLYHVAGETSEAKRLNALAAKHLAQVGVVPGKDVIYLQLSQLSEELKDYANALKYSQLYDSSKEELYNKEKSTALLQLTTKYESEFAAEQQKQTIEKLELEQSSANKTRGFLLGLIGAIGLLCISIYRGYRVKQSDNELLTQKNVEIQQKNQEIDFKNIELEEKNVSLDIGNKRLMKEIGERESIENASFARDTFLATMSHEMRTPMNNIVGLAHLLLDDSPRKEQKDFIRSMLFSANNLTVFINDVLDFSKIEAGKIALDSREFEPEKLFNDVYERFLPSIEENGNKIGVLYDDKIPNILIGDPGRLNQIITNFLMASNNHTAGGNIQVGIKLESIVERDAQIVIEIKDNGTGLSQDLINKLENPYDRSSGEDQFEGVQNVALGLVMAKRLGELQNGQISVLATEEGNRFEIKLPYHIPELSMTEVNKEDENLFANFIGKNVLVVEDNKINQLVVAKMLTNLGMNITTADNGLEALEVYKDKVFDLVLMDIQMPLMDGYKTTTEIRNLADPRKSEVPIIALTASAFLSEKEKAKLFGMDDHLGKPFSPDELITKITQSFKKHEV